MAKASDDDTSLKRLGGGRWQTRDERFSIEPQSGTWVIVDAAQTDELGLPLVRGPFPSLTAAKAAISDARSGEPAASPLAALGEAVRSRAASVEAPKAASADRADTRATATAPHPKPPKAAARKAPASGDATVDEPPDPAWLGALTPDDRRRARRLLRHLASTDVRDAEGLVRRDLAGDVPALATHAIKAALEALGPDAPVKDVVRLLTDGRDDDLGVRWRLVDDQGRRINLDG